MTPNGKRYLYQMKKCVRKYSGQLEKAGGIAENTSILTYHDENSLSCVITLAYFSAQKEY